MLLNMYCLVNFSNVVSELLPPAARATCGQLRTSFEHAGVMEFGFYHTERPPLFAARLP